MGVYRNGMEVLVEEEVNRQLKGLPIRIVTYINQVELIAYALNQLPALYATSERGLEYQIQRGRSKFGSQIIQAVQRALAAVRRDPLRMAVPLKSPAAPQGEILQQLKQLLHNDAIEWETLPNAIEQALLTADLENCPVYKAPRRFQRHAYLPVSSLQEVERSSQYLSRSTYLNSENETAIEIDWRD